MSHFFIELFGKNHFVILNKLGKFHYQTVFSSVKCKERKELLKRNKIHFSLFHKCNPSSLQILKLELSFRTEVFKTVFLKQQINPDLKF